MNTLVMDKKMVLFVCTGNTCRSPMAEIIFNQIAKGSNWYARSAGLAALPGEKAMPQAIEAVAKRGLDLTKHQSHRLNQENLEKATLVITMTESHKESILYSFPEFEDKLYSFGEIAGKNIPDPYGSRIEIYEGVAETISAGLKNIEDFLTVITGNEDN